MIAGRPLRGHTSVVPAHNCQLQEPGGHDAQPTDHWHGRTFRQFWEWFNARCIQLVGEALPEELDALHAELMEVRAAVEDGGYVVPADRLDEVIEPPM